MGRNSRRGRFGNNPKFANSHEYWRENVEHPHWNERDHSNSHVRPNVPHEIPFTDHALEFGLVDTPISENLEPLGWHRLFSPYSQFSEFGRWEPR